MRLADKLRQMESEKAPFDPESVRKIVEAYFTKYPQSSLTVSFEGYKVLPKLDAHINYVMPKHWFEPYREYMKSEGFIMEPSYGHSGFEMTWRLY